MNRVHLVAAALLLVALACYLLAQWSDAAFAFTIVGVAIELAAWVLWLRNRR